MHIIIVIHIHSTHTHTYVRTYTDTQRHTQKHTEKHIHRLNTLLIGVYWIMVGYN